MFHFNMMNFLCVCCKVDTVDATYSTEAVTEFI